MCLAPGVLAREAGPGVGHPQASAFWYVGLWQGHHEDSRFWTHLEESCLWQLHITNNSTNPLAHRAGLGAAGPIGKHGARLQGSQAHWHTEPGWGRLSPLAHRARLGQPGPLAHTEPGCRVAEPTGTHTASLGDSQC